MNDAYQAYLETETAEKTDTAFGLAIAAIVVVVILLL
jgi:hypothetical protein